MNFNIDFLASGLRDLAQKCYFWLIEGVPLSHDVCNGELIR
jgi:hypothetical protein